MGHHIDEAGRFQSDRHPDLPPDRIRLNFQNPRSERALRVLAQDYEQADSELAADINRRLDALYGTLKPGDREDIAGLAPLERLPDGVARYRKRPVEIQAIRWVGDDIQAVMDFVGDGGTRVLKGTGDDPDMLQVLVKLERSWVNVPRGHWLIRGLRGEFYPCDHEVFTATYDAVE